MTRDVAAARAAVGQAALARDEAELRAIADSLPALTAYAYERHRARAFANALRGAHDSAVAELCLGVAACPPAASTFVADSAQIRLLTDGRPPAPVRRTRVPAPAGPRLLASGAALAAAVAALVVLPGRVFEDARPEAAGITAPTRTAPPQVVVAEPTRTEAPSERGGPDGGPDASDGATLVAVSNVVSAPAPGLEPTTEGAEPPAPRAAGSKPRPRPAPPKPAPPSSPQAPAPTPPSEPAPPLPPAAPVPSASTATAPATTAPPTATSPTRVPKGKALGRAGAPGRSKQETARPAEPATAAPQPAAPAPAAPSIEASPAGPPEPHPGRGHGRERRP